MKIFLRQRLKKRESHVQSAKLTQQLYGDVMLRACRFATRVDYIKNYIK